MAGGFGFWLPLPEGGGSGAVSVISAVSLESNGVVTFSSIPSGYAALQIVANVRSTRTGNSDELYIRMGSGSVETGSVYRYVAMRRSGSDNSAVAATTATHILTNDGVPAASSNAADFGTFDAKITGHGDSSRYTSMVWQLGTDGVPFIGSGAASHLSAVAVDVITITAQNGALAAGSKAWLYGWAAS